jgi:hypothetical protein
MKLQTPTNGIMSAEQQEYLSSMMKPKTPTTPKPAPRHDEETSKTLTWAKQANKATLSKNQELRQLYQDTSGEGMSPEDVERAKTLIARDERKRQKKEKKIVDSDETTPTLDKDAEEDGATNEKVESSEMTSMETTKEDDATIKETKQKEAAKASSSSKSKRDKNKALRKRYLETDGKGMVAEQIERAKILIARDERKKQTNKSLSSMKDTTVAQ